MSQGVSSIVASWALSPVLSGIIAVALFLFVRTFVLRSEDSAKRAIMIFPFLVTATIATNGKGPVVVCWTQKPLTLSRTIILH